LRGSLRLERITQFPTPDIRYDKERGAEGRAKSTTLKYRSKNY